MSSSALVLNRSCTAVRVISGRRTFSVLCRTADRVRDAFEERFDVLSLDQWVKRSEEAVRPASPDAAPVQTPRHLPAAQLSLAEKAGLAAYRVRKYFLSENDLAIDS